jgi:hypothetical protein
MSEVPAAGLRWHYLPGVSFRPVFAAGVIRRSPDLEQVRRSGRSDLPESYLDCRPVVWFSAAEPWEPSTAMSLRRPDGTTEPLRDMEENARRGGGLFRIGVAAATAPFSWTDYRKGGFDRPEVCNRMAKAAKECRADTRAWWASDRDVPREEWVCVETWSGGRWVPWSPPAP